MKTFFVRLLLFMFCAAIAYPILIILWGELIPPKYRENLIYYNHYNEFNDMGLRIGEIPNYKDIDILFLGSSHAYRSFDTRLFKKAGYVAFNLGSSSQTIIQTELLLNKYLDMLNPKLIIFEVYPAVFSIDGIESTIELLSVDKIDYQTLKMVIKHFHVKTFNTAIYGLYRQLLNGNKFPNKILTNGIDTYIEGGFVESKMKTFHNSKVNYVQNNWIIKRQQSEAFDRTLLLIKKRKIKFILVQAPITKQLYRSYKNNSEIDNYFLLRGRYLNYNNLINLSDSLDFYDTNHLNQHGVCIFCNDLINKLHFKNN